MPLLRPTALALAILLAGCNAQPSAAPAAPAEPAAPPAATSADAAATPAEPAAAAAPASPVLGPKPVTALGTGPDGEPLLPMDEAHAPEAAPDQLANDITTTSGKDGVLRAQVLLLRAHYSSGEIDGLAGSNMAKAVRAYQAHHGLTESGELDEATWAALNKDTAPALVTYTLTQADIDGPPRNAPKTRRRWTRSSTRTSRRCWASASTASRR